MSELPLNLDCPICGKEVLGLMDVFEHYDCFEKAKQIKEQFKTPPPVGATLNKAEKKPFESKSMCLDCLTEWAPDPLAGVLPMNCPQCGSDNCGTTKEKDNG